MHPISPGDRFGRLLVLDATNRLAVECRCDCGTEKCVGAPALYRGLTRSCGCLLRETAQEKGRNNAKLGAIGPGDVFGRLTVLDATIRRSVLCKCTCGNETRVTADRLHSGHTKSCGCLKREGPRTHGLTDHPLYPTWYGVWARCTNPRAVGYRNYGGRGIKLYELWRDPARFIADIEKDLGPRPDGLLLDRVNNNGHYEPGNLRWATWETQANNRRTTWRETVTCPCCGHTFPRGDSAAEPFGD